MNEKLHTPHLLIVEDHPVFRRFLLSWLSRQYVVHAVSDGFEALKWLQAGNIPDLVLLDLEMPRVDGFQFLKNVRFSGIFSELPVIALTANSIESVSNRCSEYRVTDIFSKPYKPQELLSAIERLAMRSALRRVA